MSKKKVLLRGVFINRDTNGEGVLKVGTTLIRVSTVMGILYEKHFGIGNVNKRISNPYFGNGRISVESCLYEGTSITIEFDQMEKYDEECNDCR